MVSFLVVYGTGEGQTAKVADRIVSVLTARGHDARAVDANDAPGDVDPVDFDAVLVGASIHAGRHQSSVRKFVRRHREALSSKPTAFFQVSLSSADEEGEATAAGYVEEFVAETDWHPDRVGLFGGALRYSEYGFVKRLVMKQIAKRSALDAESGEDREFTDWGEVEAFAADTAAFVESRLGVLPPAATETDDEP